jgi:hypothetical protein
MLSKAQRKLIELLTMRASDSLHFLQDFFFPTYALIDRTKCLFGISMPNHAS